MAITAKPTKASGYLTAAVSEEVAADWHPDAGLADGSNPDAASTVVLTVPADVTDVQSYANNAAYRVRKYAARLAPTRKGYRVASAKSISDDGTEVTVSTFWAPVK